MSFIKKILIILCIVICVIIFIFLFLIKDNKIENTVDRESVNIQKDDETELYYIIDDDTGEIKGASKNKEDLQIFIDDPNYDINPLLEKKTDIKSWEELYNGSDNIMNSD